MKLFESIMKKFDDDNLGLLGAVLGEHEVKVRDGVEAAVPEILCAIGDQVKSDEGRGMLWRELRDTDEKVAASFPSQLHYQNSLSLVEKGKQQLSGLVGHDLKAITTRVSHAADIGSSSASKMVGAVSPLIFSSLAAWQKKEKVDAEGWQKLFADQSEGLRERAVRASTRRFDAKTGQRTFPSFDKTIATGQGGEDGKWTASSGFTPGYTGSAKEKFQPSGLTSSSPSSANADKSQVGKVAAGAAGAAAVAGVAAAGGKAMGVASSATAQPNSLAGNATSATSASDALKAEPSTGDTVDLPRWVPDKENLRRERERTAIERARTEREEKLAKEDSGGLGWLWWQIALLAGLAGLGWFFRGEISEAFNPPSSEATADLDIPDDSVSELPSAAADSVEDLDTQIGEISVTESTGPQEATSTNSIADSSAQSEVMEGSLESLTVDNEAPQLSSPAATPETDLATLEQSEDAPMLAPAADGDVDFDLQVESALTSLQSSVEEIKDEASAKSAVPKLEESITSLEDLLKTSSTWGDADKETIDIQLEEAAGVFEKLEKSITKMPDVKDVVTPLFERLEKLLVPQQVAP